MTQYAVFFRRSARKELQRLSPPNGSRVLDKIVGLEEEQRPPGCKKLQGTSDLWRLRVGDYRIVYLVVDKVNEVEIVAIRHRSEVYR